VDISTALSLDLKNLLRVLEFPDRDIERSLRALRFDVALAVPTFVGLSMTLVVEGQPVTLTSMDDEALDAAVGSSLSLPLTLTSQFAAGSELVLYATAPGAFVDLAADLQYALRAADNELTLDRHLARTPRSGIVGVEELSLINRALGVLVGGGRTFAEARAQLQLEARQANLPPSLVAAYLISTTE